MAANHGRLAHHFDTLEQQHQANLLGMWLFLATEVLFFGGLFLAYAVFRYWHPDAFAHGSRHLDIVMGTINTAVLIGSSLTMALAVHGAQVGDRRMLLFGLSLTIALGAVFLLIKAFEWRHDFVDQLIPRMDFDERRWLAKGIHPGEVQLFFVLYFSMTGLHGLHMIAGIGVLAILVVLARRGRFGPEHYTAVELTGLYWHFVDIIWIFLFPMFYLLGTHLPHS